MDTNWIKSSHSGKQGNCVQVHIQQAWAGTPQVQVKDSKGGPYSPILTFTHDEWLAFVAGVKDGEFDL